MITLTKINFVAVLILTSCSSILNASLQSSDLDYKTYYNDNSQYVYSHKDEPIIKEFALKHSHLLSIYTKEFNWELDQTMTLFLSSERNQTSNGFAQTTPLLKTTFLSNGANFLDVFAIKNWLDILSIHETAHLFQLNAKESTAAFLHTLFSNAYHSGSNIFYPFIHPNNFLPTFITEGNATYNESRFSLGGRLYSGEYRAIAYKIMQKLTLRKFMNDHLGFETGIEKYVVGAYFFNYIQEKYGEEKINTFFKNNARWTQTLYPFLLNTTFKQTFGEGYEKIFNDFLIHYQTPAEFMLNSKEQALLSGWRISPFHKQGKFIYFLSNKDNKQFPTLNIVSSKSGKIFKQKTLNIPMGKIFPFKENNRVTYYSSTSLKHNTYETSAGLFQSNSVLKTKSKGKVYFDRQRGNDLYVLANDAFSEFKLYKNDKIVAKTHSSALFNQKLKPLYFVQEGSIRRLFQDKSIMCEYKGYYGKVIDSFKDQIFFIASTELGSSLFLCENNSIYRILASDVVIDAKRLTSGKFLIKEVDNDTYHIKVVTTNKKQAQIPYFFQYQFKPLSYLDIANNTVEPVNDTIFKSKDYNSLTQLKLSGMYPSLTFISSRLFTGLEFVFRDPAEWNLLQFSYGNVSGYHRSQLYYLNSRHNFNYFLAGQWFDNIETDASNIIGESFAKIGFIGWNYPLFYYNGWGLNFGQSYSYEDKAINTLLQKEKYFTHNLIHKLNLNFSKKYSRNFYPYRLFSLSLANNLTSHKNIEEKDFNINWGISTQFVYDLGSEYVINPFISLNYPYSSSLESSTSQLNSIIFNPFYLPHPLFELINDSKLAGVKIAKPFDTDIYFYKLPLSLRRMALNLTYLYLENESDTLQGIGSGLDFELLIGHKFVVINGVNLYSLVFKNYKEQLININFKGKF